MALFLLVMSLEMNISDSYAVNSVGPPRSTILYMLPCFGLWLQHGSAAKPSPMQMLRSSLQISNVELSMVNTQDDFWNFFEVLVDKLFQTQWYNGKASWGKGRFASIMHSRSLHRFSLLKRKERWPCTADFSAAF
jgi:hypothetical protein